MARLLSDVNAAFVVVTRRRFVLGVTRRAGVPPVGAIGRRRPRRDAAPVGFARINKLCDEQGCDTILYALFTWDQNSPVVRNHNAIFGGLDHIQRFILEVGQRGPKGIDHSEVWSRGQQAALATLCR